MTTATETPNRFVRVAGPDATINRKPAPLCNGGDYVNRRPGNVQRGREHRVGGVMGADVDARERRTAYPSVQASRRKPVK
jgi:hypothetical protein